MTDVRRHEGNDIAFARCSCWNRMDAGAYVCKSCALKIQGGRQPFKLVAKPRFRLPMNRRHASALGDLCARCPKLEECRECALSGRVLACEWPSEQDALRVAVS